MSDLVEQLKACTQAGAYFRVPAKLHAELLEFLTEDTPSTPPQPADEDE